MINSLKNLSLKQNKKIVELLNFQKINRISSGICIMNTLREVRDDDLDGRMTDETKSFVKKYLRVTDPRTLLITPLKISRQLRNENCKLLNSDYNFQNLKEKEYFIKNINDGYEIPVTAYIPKNTTPNSTLIVFFHGGGWVYGSRISHRIPVATLADKTNSIWLSVEYRLAPEHKHPTGLQDLISVVKWAAENKKNEFGLTDESRIGVCGDSSGGCFAATISHQLRDFLSFQVLIYPCVDLSLNTTSFFQFTRDCYILLPEVMKFFVNNYLNNPDDAENPNVSPIRQNDFKNLPKALIIASELDVLVDDSKNYHKKLLDNNCVSELHIIKGVNHGFFAQSIYLPNAFKEACDHINTFIKKD